MKILFDVGWEAAAFLKDRSKLDFYFSLKKNFGFENYLDFFEKKFKIFHFVRVFLVIFALFLKKLQWGRGVKHE